MAASHDSKRQDKAATNRKALHDYFVIDRLEAGVELRGTEVKSVRSNNVTLTGGFATIDAAGLMLHGVHIAPYECGNRFNHEAVRPRRLLMHKRELGRLAGQLAQKGHTLIPLRMYFRGRWAKVEIGICKGKQDADKRETLRRRDADKEARNAIARAR